MRRQKSEVGTEEINYDAVKTSSKNLSQSKKLDATDVGLQVPSNKIFQFLTGGAA